MECNNCKTELTQMKNDAGENTCLRCLKCHPMPNNKPVVKAKKENVKVDEPWTEERIRNIVVDELENWHKTTVLASQKEGWGTDRPSLVATDVAIPDKIDWRGKAKELGIAVYDQELKRPRLKADVLADIEAQTSHTG